MTIQVFPEPVVSSGPDNKVFKFSSGLTPTEFLSIDPFNNGSYPINESFPAGAWLVWNIDNTSNVWPYTSSYTSLTSNATYPGAMNVINTSDTSWRVRVQTRWSSGNGPFQGYSSSYITNIYFLNNTYYIATGGPYGIDTPEISISTDGTSWTNTATTVSDGSSKYGKTAWFDGTYYWVHSYPSKASISTDLINWTSRNNPLGNFPKVAYRDSTLNRIIQSDNNGTIYTSTNSLNWSTRPKSDLNSPAFISKAGNYIYIGGMAESTSMAHLVFSTDGLNWSSATLPSTAINSEQISGVAYNGTNRYVAVSTAGYIHTSTDGINWTTSITGGTVGSPIAYNTVVYGNDGWFLALGGRFSTSTGVRASTDGITWTSAATAVSSAATSVVTHGFYHATQVNNANWRVFSAYYSPTSTYYEQMLPNRSSANSINVRGKTAASATFLLQQAADTPSLFI